MCVCVSVCVCVCVLCAPHRGPVPDPLHERGPAPHPGRPGGLCAAPAGAGLHRGPLCGLLRQGPPLPLQRQRQTTGPQAPGGECEGTHTQTQAGTHTHTHTHRHTYGLKKGVFLVIITCMFALWGLGLGLYKVT